MRLFALPITKRSKGLLELQSAKKKKGIETMKQLNKENILKEYGKEIKSVFGNVAKQEDISNSSLARFRTIDSNICARVKTALTFTGNKQSSVRGKQGIKSMQYDLATQGKKIDFSRGYEYYLIDMDEDSETYKELTEEGYEAIKAVSDYFENRISFEWLVDGTPITEGDKLMNSIYALIAENNKNHGVNHITPEYKHSRSVRGGKGKRFI